MPEKFKPSKQEQEEDFTQGLDYPTEKEAGFEGLTSGINPDLEVNDDAIDSNKSREVIKLPPRENHLYLKDGIEEWFKLVDEYNLAKGISASHNYIGQEEVRQPQGLRGQIYSNIESGRSGILHQDPKDIAQVFRDHDEFVKATEKYREQYTQDFPPAEGFDADNVLHGIINELSFLTGSDQKIPARLEKIKNEGEASIYNLLGILRPFEEQISIIEALPEGEEKEKQINKILEEAILAGKSIAYRDIPQRWAIFSEKNREYRKKIEEFYKTNEIDHPIYPKYTAGTDLLYQVMAAELYGQLNPPKALVKKIGEKFDNALIQEMAIYLKWCDEDATWELRGSSRDGGYPEVKEMRNNGKLNKDISGSAPFRKFYPSIEINGEITNLKNADQLAVLLIEALRKVFPSAIIESVLNLEPGKILIENDLQTRGLKITYGLDPTGRWQEKYPIALLANELEIYGGLLPNWIMTTEEDKEKGVGHIYLEHRD